MSRSNQPTEQRLVRIGNALDHVVTAPIANWALLKEMPLATLYEAARLQAEGPLSSAAGHLLSERVMPGDRVLILSGFLIKDYLRPETDGLVGAAVLSRALALGLRAVPVGITDPTSVSAYQACMSSAGLVPADTGDLNAGRHRCAVLAFPTAEAEAREAADRILDELAPAAVVAIERPGANSSGRYHGGGGFDITSWTAKTDVLFARARARGVLTIGVGDLGNELGLGAIRDQVRNHVEYGAVCRCACGDGIAASQAADVTFVANVANWGAYAVAAYLACLLGDDRVFHTPELELRIIDDAVRAGAIDPVGGQSRPFVDGVSVSTNAAVVELLRHVVSTSTRHGVELEEYRASWEAE